MHFPRMTTSGICISKGLSTIINQETKPARRVQPNQKIHTSYVGLREENIA